MISSWVPATWKGGDLLSNELKKSEVIGKHCLPCRSTHEINRTQPSEADLARKRMGIKQCGFSNAESAISLCPQHTKLCVLSAHSLSSSLTSTERKKTDQTS